MSLKLALLLALLAASAGIGFGYLLRLIISLGKKGSMELDIKQMELSSREEAQRIISEAESRAKDIIQRTQVEIKEREDRAKKTEDRFIKKEEFLDKRQLDLEKEAEEDLLIRMQKLETEGQERFEARAKEILSTVIQRLAVSISLDNCRKY